MPVQAKIIPVEVVQSNEPWNTYILADGTKVQSRMNLLDFERTDKFQPDGSPVYLFKKLDPPQLIITVPDGLKKKSVTAI